MLEEKQNLIKSFYLPATVLGLLWVIHLFQYFGQVDLGFLGIYPRSSSGLFGILTAPLVHGSWDHLISNSLPFFFLCLGIILFYETVSLPVLLTSYLLPGLCTWIAARPSYHIGISSMIYALAFFLFFSGVFSKDRRALALTLVVSFLYGSMIWGIFPTDVAAPISWEGHLFGAITGVSLAFIYRKRGPQGKKYAWEDETDNGEYEYFEPWNYRKYFPPPEGFSHPDQKSKQKS